MENQQSNSKLKAVILVLALLLVGSLGYIYKLTSDVKSTQAILTTTKTEKETVVDNLEALKAKYDEAIAENTTISDDLVAEREKVIGLLAEVKKSKGDASAMAKYKNQYFALESKMKTLIQENEVLKNDNQKLVTQRDSTVTVLGEARKTNEDLLAMNDGLTKTVEKAAKLKVLNTKGVAFKVKSSGKEINTDKASRADMLKISYTIAENEVAKSGTKSYQVQVIDSKNNVLGDKKTETYGEKILTYSFDSAVNYENKTVDVVQNLPGKDFEKGVYYVNIFDKSELVSSTSFTLK